MNLPENTGSRDDIYRAFFESSTVPMILVDKDTTILMCNKAFEKFSGYGRDELSGKLSWIELIANSDEREKMKEYHHRRRLDDSAVPDEYECRIRNKKGKDIDILLNVCMVPSTLCSMVYVSNVSEKKRNEVWHRAIFDNTGLSTMILAPDMVIIGANSEWENLSGYTIEETEGRLPWTDFVCDEDLDRMISYHRMRRSDPEVVPRKYEFRFKRRNGEIREVISSVTMIPGYENSIASLMDITELKEIERESRKLEEQLRQSEKLESIGLLAGGIAHDFNNMLAAITGYAHLISLKVKDLNKQQKEKTDMLYKLSRGMLNNFMNGNSDCQDHGITDGFSVIKQSITDIKNAKEQLDEISEMAGDIINASEHAERLIRQLLAFARKQTLVMIRYDLNMVLEGFSKILRQSISSSIEIIFDHSDKECFIMADRVQLEQIILNLSINARDAMPDGGKITVKTFCKFLDSNNARLIEGLSEGNYVVLEVSDTGFGIDPDMAGRIFEPFFSTKGSGRGTGLGLSTVYGIVKQHNGVIQLESIPETGTTFRIFFPAAI